MKQTVLYLGLVLSLVACTKNKVSTEKEIHLVSPAKVSGYDPALGGDLYTSDEMGKVYEGLYEFHPTKRPYELIPNLAESMPEVSADGLTYTFKIKKGVLFHDDVCFKDGKGREMVAEDVIYSIKRLADPKVMSRGWWIYDEKVVGLNEWREKNTKTETTSYDDSIEGLVALDSHTLKLKLTKANPQLLYGLAMAYSFVVAREAVAYYGKEFLNHPVGTGPFQLPKFDQTNKIIYTKNPKFREKYFPSEDRATLRVPVADKIVVHIITESQPRWLNFQKAKVDLLEIPKDNFDQAVTKSGEIHPELAEKGVKLVAMPMLDVTFYAFNHEDPLFKNNVKLRQAISLAYDRDESNKLFYNSTAFKANGVIPPGMAGYREDFKNPYVQFDLERAKKLLAEAGYPEGKGLPEITVQTTNDTVNRQMLEFFTSSMAKIGIKIKIGTNTWPELVNKVSKKQHQMYTMAWSADYPDAENFLGLLYCPNKAPGSNGSNYCNPKFDALFKKAIVMQDGPERTKLYQELNEWVAQEVPWLFAFHRTKFYVHHGWLENFNFMEFRHSQFQYLGVDLAAKKKLISNF